MTNYKIAVQFAKEHNVSEIVCGNCKGVERNTKKKKRLNKNTRQKIAQLEYGTLIDQLTYKSKLNGIEFILAKESYTSQKCPKCGKPIAVNVHFCKWCGSSLSQTQKNPPTVSDCQPVVLKSTETDIPITNVCKNCGHTIKATAMFCKWCGSPCSK